MKVLIVLALVAAASAVPMQVYMSEKVRVVDAPRPVELPADERRAIEKVQIVENPIFDAEPVANDPILAVKFVESPVEKMSVHSIELPAAALPSVNIQASGHQSLFFAPIDEPIATFESNEKQTDVEIDQVRVVETPADDLLPVNVETAVNSIQVNAPEAVKVVEAPVNSYEKVAPSELESIRVVRPSPLDMARESVQVVV